VTVPRALITGVTGQDGSYLAELLLGEGADVVGLARPGSDRPVPEGVRVVEGDLRDPERLDAVIREIAPDELYHLAAPTFVPASWESPEATLDEIAGATATVVIAAGAVGARVVVPSSPEMFGDCGVSPQDENAPRRPRSPYGVAKLAAHELVRVMREGHDHIQASSVITYNHESPRRPVRFVTRQVTRAAAAISLGIEQELVLGDLEAKRDWSHARDIVRGMVLAVRHPDADDYVLASGVARSVRDLVQTAFGIVGVDVERHLRIDDSLVRTPESTVMVGDASRARQKLGWTPEISFEALIREMVEADLAALS
jgi:GDPmannose 4,6-dehydratase